MPSRLKVSNAIRLAAWSAHGIPAPEQEFKFCATRRWRFDYAWPRALVAVEIEGGVWVGGRHTRGAGFIADMEKYNWAAAHGWKVLRYTPEQSITTESCAEIAHVINAA